MNDIVRHQRPATVVDTRPVRIMTAAYHHKADLSRAVHRQAARGQVRPIDRAPIYDPTTGEWFQRVRVIKDPPPAWRKPVLVAAGAGAVVGALILLGYLVWVTLAPFALTMLGALLVGAFVMLVAAMRRPAVEVETTTTTKVRVS
jgi:hypothetical protein